MEAVGGRTFIVAVPSRLPSRTQMGKTVCRHGNTHFANHLKSKSLTLSIDISWRQCSRAHWSLRWAWLRASIQYIEPSANMVTLTVVNALGIARFSGIEHRWFWDFPNLRIGSNQAPTRILIHLTPCLKYQIMVRILGVLRSSLKKNRLSRWTSEVSFTSMRLTYVRQSTD